MGFQNYFEREYSSFWMKQVNVYGIDNAMSEILELLKEKRPKSAYEVGIGTAWPIADSLYKEGIVVSGNDISEKLINLALNKYPEMKLYVGDIADINLQGKYDLVYCIRTSWYIKDFRNAIRKMNSILSDDGALVFNVINKDNKDNNKGVLSSGIIKFLYRFYAALRVVIFNKDYIASPSPYYYRAKDIIKWLEEEKLNFKIYYEENDSIYNEDNLKAQKLLFYCWKRNAK